MVVGFAAGPIPSVKASYPLLKDIEVSGLQISDYRKRAPDQVRACFEEVFLLFEAGRPPPPPVRLFPLAEARAALEALLDRTVEERIVLIPDGPVGVQGGAG